MEQDAREIIRDVRNNANKEKILKQSIREAAMRVVRDLSANNVFGFDCALASSESECLDFVAKPNGLMEFMESAKIEKIEQEVNVSYGNALVEVDSHTRSVMQHKEKIDKIIQNINRDFSEKNFAGVIEKIEIRTQESEEGLYQNIKDILDFNALHGEEVGEKNLFLTGDTN